MTTLRIGTQRPMWFAGWIGAKPRLVNDQRLAKKYTYPLTTDSDITKLMQLNIVPIHDTFKF